MGFPHYGDAALLHGLQQGGLGLGGGAVDFIRQHDVGEDRAFLEDEGFCPVHFLEDGSARDVPGQQVRRELDAARRERQRPGEPLDQFRLAQAGQPFQQDVAARQHADEDEFNEVFLAEQHLVHGGGQGVKLSYGMAEFFLGERGEGIHGELPDDRGFLEKSPGSC